MTLFKDKYKIDSKRLKNWDYSSEGMYFITLVAKNRECIFGSIEEDKMILNKNGQIIETELLKSIKIRKNWFFHNWIVMPNHIHLLIEIQNNQIPIIDTNNIDTDIVEAHSSASPSSISTKIGSNVAETHCCAPLRDNWDGIENENKKQLNAIKAYNIETDIVGSHIVEVHSSASPSGISTMIGSNVAETHCCAPLRDNWDGIENGNKKQLDAIKAYNIETDIVGSHIVEAHSSAFPSSISTKIGSNVAETHCCAPLRDNWGGIENENKKQLDAIKAYNIETDIVGSHIVEAHSSASPFSMSTKIGSNVAETHCCAPLRDNWDGIENENKKQLDAIKAYNIETDIVGSHIVEAHSSASPSGISTMIGSNVAETHCCAPLRDNLDGIENGNKNRKKENDNHNSLITTLSRKPNSISSFVALFKSVTTKQIGGFESIWQSNYHDHIVRSHKRFETIYNYIKTNPRSWEMDSMKL